MPVNVDADMTSIILSPYDELVSVGNKNIKSEVQISGRNFQVKQKYYRGPREASGYYAKFYDGWFIAFVSKDDQVFIGWRKELIALNDIKKIDRCKKALWIEFKCHLKNGQKKRFLYESSIWTPWRILFDRFVFDDWWPLLCDMPSSVEASFKSGELLDHLKSRYYHNPDTPV